MQLKFLKTVKCLNCNMAIAIGTNSELKITAARVDSDGELQIFDGANARGIANSLYGKILANTITDIASYKFDADERVLKFTCYHNATKTDFCNDIIDVTTYEVHELSEQDFIIIDTCEELK